MFVHEDRGTVILMAGHFHPVSSAYLEGFLRKAGFTRTVAHREVVYVRRSMRDKNVMVKVYTSITADSSVVVRKKGTDAIRVCVVFDDGNGCSFGIGSFPKVLRTTSDEAVVDRLRSRIRDAVKRATEYLDNRDAKRVH